MIKRIAVPSLFCDLLPGVRGLDWCFQPAHHGHDIPWLTGNHDRPVLFQKITDIRMNRQVRQSVGARSSWDERSSSGMFRHGPLYNDFPRFSNTFQNLMQVDYGSWVLLWLCNGTHAAEARLPTAPAVGMIWRKRRRTGQCGVAGSSMKFTDYISIATKWCLRFIECYCFRSL